jgi:hypothetical protein
MIINNGGAKYAITIVTNAPQLNHIIGVHSVLMKNA